MLAQWLLRILTPDAVRSQLLGDLAERFHRVHRERGWRAARAWYWRNVLSPDVLRLRSTMRRRRWSKHRWTRPWIAGLGSDLRYALRMVRQRPGVSAAVVTTLALGIGTTTAVFSLVHSVLLRPLPYAQPDDLVMVFRTVPRYDLTRSVASYPDFVDWRAEVTAFDDLAAYALTRLTYLAGTAAEQWQGARITAGLFPLLGTEPQLGRWPTPDEDRPGARPVMLLGYGLWQSRFGGAQDIVGRALTLNGESYTAIGVMPAEFDFPAPQVQFWVPLRADPARWERDTNFLTLIGRLAPGATVADAQTELERVAERIDRTTPGIAEGFGEGYGVWVESRHAFVVRNARSALLVFLGAVGLVLAMACANVANLMLVRGTERRRELALRSAMGAGRGRLIRQLLTESLVLAGAGGAIGVVTAFAIVRGVIVLGPTLPRAQEIAVDPVALLFSVVVTLACGVVVGVLPAAIATRHGVAETIKEGSTASGVSRGGHRLQQGFVVGQIAIAIVLVVSAALLVTSFNRLASVTPGFDPSNVVAARVTLPPPDDDAEANETAAAEAASARWVERRNQFFDAVAQAVAAEGTARVGLAYGIPFGRYTFSRPMFAEGTDRGPGASPTVHGNIVATTYFVAMGIPIVRGRGFEERDRFDAPPVIVLSQTTANLLWPGLDPLGRRVRLGSSDDDSPWVTVIGVAADVRLRSLADDPAPMYYRPLEQVPWVDGLFVITRSTRPEAETLDAVRRAVWSLDPRLPITDVTTTRDLVDDTLTAPRFRATVLAGFGLVAVALAILGVYAVMAFNVGRQTRDIGIRMALGAQRFAITSSVLANGAALTAMGAAIGIVLALGLTRFLSGMLFGLSPRDPLTFIGSAATFAVVALAACYFPARRAARLDPVNVLKE